MSCVKNVDEFLANNKPFFQYLMEMEEKLESISLEKIVETAGGADRVAVISVDVIEGFCRTGPLASDRVKGIINPIVKIFEKAYSLGIRNFALPQDSHPADSPEFKSFPPHCITGTEEAETVKEFKELHFFNEMKVFSKQSVNSGINTGLGEWLMEKAPKKIVVVGDCTDLCTYQLALFISHLGHSTNTHWDVIIPVNAIETYDLPVETAGEIGAVPHPGDLLHVIFIYHMLLNGIQIAREIV